MLKNLIDSLADSLPGTHVTAEGGATTSGFSKDGVENWLLKWGDIPNMTKSGQRVNGASAMHSSAYFACIRNISEDIGRLPITIRRTLPNGGKEEMRELPLFRKLHRRPNPDMSIMDFVSTLNHWAMGWGNGYAEIALDNRGVPELFPIHPSRVKPIRDNSPQKRVFYEVKLDDVAGAGAKPIVLPAREIFHLRNLGDGINGYSVFRLAQESIGISLAQDKLAGAFFGNGAHIGGAIESDHGYSEEMRRAFQKELQNMYTGSDRAFKIPFLPKGLRLVKTAVNPQEAEMISQRQFQVSEIARWFRVPPHIIQDLSRSTFNNLENQGQEYVTYALMPWIKRWELEIDEKLLDGDGELFAEFNANALMRGNMQARSNYYRTMFNIGSITPNRIRLMEGDNPSDEEGADKSYIQGNMVPLDVASTGASFKPGQMGTTPEEPGRPEENKIGSMMPVAINACEYILRKERQAVSRMSKKFNDFQFKLALKTFYENDVVSDTIGEFAPILESCGIDLDITDYVWQLSSMRMAEAMKELTYNPSMDAWEGRAQEMAEGIVCFIKQETMKGE